MPLGLDAGDVPHVRVGGHVGPLGRDRTLDVEGLHVEHDAPELWDAHAEVGEALEIVCVETQFCSFSLMSLSRDYWGMSGAVEVVAMAFVPAH